MSLDSSDWIGIDRHPPGFTAHLPKVAMSPAAAENLMLFGLVLFLAGACWRYGIGIVYEARMAQTRKDAEKLRTDIERVRAEGEGFDEAYQEARPKIERLRRDIAMAKRRTAELAKGRFAVIQQMGRPGEDRRCFVFELFRGDPAAGQMEGRPTVDRRFWNHRNFVEVWAQDADTASRQVTLTFDARSGYRRSALIEERRNAG